MRKLLILLILLPLVASAQYFPPSSGGSGGAGMLPSATAPAWAALYNYFGGTQLQLDWGNNWPVSTVLPNGNIFASLSTFPNGSCQTAGLVTDPFGNIIASKTAAPGDVTVLPLTKPYVPTSSGLQATVTVTGAAKTVQSIAAGCSFEIGWQGSAGPRPL